MKRLKILISAYACRPNEGSEPGVGWDTVQELIKYHDVWVLTRPDNQTAIEAELAKNPIAGLKFIYCKLPFWARWWKPIQLPHYYLWQFRAYLVARKIHANVEFDIAHHITYVRYWAPSFVSLLPIPFVWGPVGGGENAPNAFLKDLSLRGKYMERLRNLSRIFGESDPFTRLTKQRSAAIFAATKDTAKRLQHIGAAGVQVLPAIGLSKEDIENLEQLPGFEGKVFRFISIGRLLHWKGFHLGLRAFAQANLPDSEYWIVGDGPEMKRLQKLALDLGISDRVKFWGWLSRNETLSKLGESAILVHPSLHDSGGGVCMEAMAAGRPVICLDLGGPAVQVTEETGFKIPAHTPEQAVADLAHAMLQISQDSAMLTSMGRAGQQRIHDNYRWEIKGEIFTHLYQKLVRSPQISTSDNEYKVSKNLNV
jgi:glycosyltransferase involved in cell wall biosynthesis